MGWDAYSLTHSEQVAYGSDALDLVQRAIFWKANAELFRRTGSGGQLINGMLGSRSLPFLIRATPIVCFDLDIEDSVLTWPEETVKEANDKANWDYAVDDWFDEFDGYPMDSRNCRDRDLDEYQRWQTRLFLEACADNSLAILFNW